MSIKTKAYICLVFGLVLSTVCFILLPPHLRQIAGGLIEILFLAVGGAFFAVWLIRPTIKRLAAPSPADDSGPKRK